MVCERIEQGYKLLASAVLILVLVEDGLWEQLKQLDNEQRRVS